MKFSENPFLKKAMVDYIDSEVEEETPEERQRREHKEMMEQDGFTLVTAEDTNPNRIKVRDGVTGTTINGISQEKAKAIFEEQQERKLATGSK